MVVEDDEDSLELARRLVQGIGHAVLVARDGEQGLASARSARPDLVLLDMRMPGIDGLTVVRELRRDPQLSSVPVIAVSADVGDDERAQAIAAGCDEFVGKPYRPEQLRAAIRRWLADKPTE